MATDYSIEAVGSAGSFSSCCHQLSLHQK